MRRLLDKMNNFGYYIFKHFHIIVILALVITIIPLLWIGVYNSPCVDDYSFSAYSKIVWEDTGSIFLTLRQAVLTTLDRYSTWQGTWTTSFLIALQPGIWNYHFYAVVPFFTIGTLCVSTFCFFRFLLKRVMNWADNIWIGVACCFLILAIETIPSPVEGFFWYTGAAAYLIPYCLLLLLITNLFKLVCGQYKHYRLLMLFSFFLVFLVAGGNYVSGLLSMILLTMFGAYSIYKKKHIRSVWAVWILYAGCFLLNMTAPGNSVRQAAFTERLGAVKSVFLSFYYCIKYIGEEWNGWSIGAWLLVIAFLTYPSIKRASKCVNPILLLFGTICVVSAMFTPTLYAISNTGAGRVHNIIYLTYLFGLLINVLNLLIWIKKKNEKENDFRNLYYLQFVSVVSAVLLAVCMFSWVDRNYYTSTSAWKSLISGEAQQYAKENEEREMLLTSGEKNVVLDKHTVFPKLLMFADITVDPDDWTNQHMCRYYRIDTVQIKKQDDE